MIENVEGNLLEADTEALVNTVNTVGVMGKGIALQFKRAFPEVFKDYAKACKEGRVVPGKMFTVERGGLTGGPRWIINFPTKRHCRSKSRMEDIESGLESLADEIGRLGITSIALPPLGCGYGGLAWGQVYPRIKAALEHLSDVRIQVYAPGQVPEAHEMPNRTQEPNMTDGRAALLGLLKRYLAGLLDPTVSLLEVHKLMYFMQVAGEPLELDFKKEAYGPYAVNLRQVLNHIEGHFISGFGDGQDDPTKPIEPIGDAVQKAESRLAQNPETLERLNRVQCLIDGFEDSYGMELLSSVQWVMTENSNARNDINKAVNAVQEWNSSKRERLQPDHIQIAWQRIKEQGWTFGE